MTQSRRIIHIDMDAFFASIEQRNNNELRGKPVIVARSSEMRGVVATCSYEARQYGVRSAMPTKIAQKLCRNGIIIEPRLDVYREVSEQIHEIFYRYTNIVEPLSLDEAYLEVSESANTMEEAKKIAIQIKKDILKEVRLNSSAGISYNKFIAKIASDYNKPNGILMIEEAQAQAFIDTLMIKQFYGIGKITERTLTNMGINTGKDLRMLTLGNLENIFKKRAYMVYQLVRGIDNRPLECNRIRKSISREITYKDDFDASMYSILERLIPITEYLEGKLEEHHRLGSTVTLIIRTDNFVRIARSYSTKEPIYKKNDIMNMCKKMLEKGKVFGKIRLLGVKISKLTESVDSFKQISVFDNFYK